ncbi:MAG: SpvB/TcaC N-terminal domain-containing protein, partial [Sulfurifustaceae bacterium]
MVLVAVRCRVGLVSVVRLLALISVAAIATAIATLQAFAAPVGATAGDFNVDHNGGANYTIPILGPPGTAGMVPHLALTYTKQVENPIVGVGFSISGLSVITRCGRTKMLDGQKGGASYDSNDRFCLDG